MKKIAFYYVLILSGFVAFVSCEGREWDTHDELEALTTNWATIYVSNVLDHVFEVKDTTYSDNGRITVITSMKDTMNLSFSWEGYQVDDDSTNIVSTLIQIGDSSTVTVDGYRYSDEFWAHLYTVDPGIINYEGKFHIDFYEIGKTTPWAWGEITYLRNRDDYRYYPYRRSDTQVGRY